MRRQQQSRQPISDLSAGSGSSVSTPDWRKALRASLLSGFAAVQISCKGKQLDETIEDEDARLREISSRLAQKYGSPRLGNKSEPIDELIYIILSRKTRESAYQASFKLLKERYPSWDELLEDSSDEIRSFVDTGGLGTKKAKSILGALRIIKSEFGSCTLAPATEWSDSELLGFLVDLPEVGPKSALCIMMYSFGRPVLPVDTHVGRALARIAPFHSLGVDLIGLNHKKLQQILPPLIPPDLRYSLHVNLIPHGRKICRFRKPLCGQCSIQNLCIFGDKRRS